MLRPRITIQVIAPNTELDQKTLSFDLSLDLTLTDLKSFVNAETNIAPESQHFFLNNQPVQGGDDQRTLADVGLKDEDMLAVLIRQPGQQNAMGGPRAQPQTGRRTTREQPEQEIETMRQSILSNPNAMQQLRDQRPALAEAINDSARFKEALMRMEQEAEAIRNEQLEQMRLLNDDPFNVDAQRKIEEMIRQESVQENLQFAYEYNPEGTLLYFTTYIV